VTASPIVISRGEVTRLTFPLSAAQQRFIGCFFILHGLAHAAVGIWAAETGRWWLVASLWELAMVGFIAAGLGALGVAGMRELWRAFTLVAASASILLFLSNPNATFLLGVGIDVTALALVAFSQGVPTDVEHGRSRAHRVRHLSGVVVSWLLIIYVAVVVAMRQWNVQWGTTPADRATPLPGDQLTPVAHYRIDHGITINAPADAVWPWVIQIGQDRGGFYSYSALENAIGARVTNAEQIIPEWQSRRVGEIVPSVPADWLGGRFGSSFGWKVVQIVPDRAIVLDGWGTFALVPINDTATRMLVRTRGEGIPSQIGVALSPLSLLVFEPAHLIMERRMLIGIKERAERGQERTFFAKEDL
jgi:hypothetical protein